MKKMLSIPLIVLLFGLGCKKDPVITPAPIPAPIAPTLPLPPPTANIPPVAKAGRDTTITLPLDSIWLDGSASFDPDGSITLFQWQRISGPEARGNALFKTNLVKSRATLTVAGIYQFRLAIIDNAGALAYDTIQIKVNDFVNPPELAGKEFVFNDLVGVYDWDTYGTFLSTPDKPELFIHPYIKVEVFVKPDTSLNWIPVESFREVIGNSFLNPYYYLIEGYKMVILENYPADKILGKKSAVKIRFR